VSLAGSSALREIKAASTADAAMRSNSSLIVLFPFLLPAENCECFSPDLSLLLSISMLRKFD